MIRTARFAFSSSLLLCSALVLSAADWPQWRGPSRNGVLSDSPPLLDTWPADGPKKLWDSEPVPSDDDGGHSSPVVAGSRVYLSVVWHTDVPTETRAIDELVMRQLGFQSVAGWAKELVDKMERTRESIDPQLRGKKLDEFMDQWVAENLDRRQRELAGSYVKGRFRKGKLAIPLADYDKMNAVKNKRFANETEFKKWLDDQGFADFVKEQVLAAVPPTQKVAEDVILCLDLATGKTIWKTKSPGEPTGRGSSSTPCVADGRVFAMGSTHLYCADADKGKLLWSAPLVAKGPGSSPLAVDGTVVVLDGRLMAFEAATGKKLWEQPKVGGANSSPAATKQGGKTVVICNSRNDIAGVDLLTGNILWTAPGGGDSTPAISGDNLIVFTKTAAIGLAGFKLTATGVEKLWNVPIEAVRTQSSPIIHDGHVYLFDDDQHMCVDLATGKVAWKQKVPSTITSPVLADGKVFTLVNNGNNLLMVKATPEDRVELAKANIRALWVPSPAVANGRLLIRFRTHVGCFDLTAPSKSPAAAL